MHAHTMRLPPKPSRHSQTTLPPKKQYAAIVLCRPLHTPGAVHKPDTLSVGSACHWHFHSGSGKTAAFLLPIIAAMENANSRDYGPSPYALILTPTRELAMQTYDECRKFADTTFIRAVCLIGGEPAMEQWRKIQQGAHIWVCTPGIVEGQGYGWLLQKGMVQCFVNPRYAAG